MPEVIVIGGANIDIKGRSHAGLIPATSNPGDVIASLGGVARNIAHNLALLGIATAFAGFAGDDSNGHRLRRETEAAGVDVSMLGTCEVSTGVYLAILDDRGELVSAINDMRCTEALTAEYLIRHEARLAKARMLVADCNIGLDCLVWLFDFARRHHVKLLIEPISVPKSRKLLALPSLRGGFAITPNLSQLAALTGLAGETAAVGKLHRMGFENAIVHCGKAGVIASDGHASPWRIAAIAGDTVTDVTGAGDAAVAGLIFGLVSGFDLGTSARIGQAAAALKVQSLATVAANMNRDSLLTLAGLG
jgi:pseudouridine kinase